MFCQILSGNDLRAAAQVFSRETHSENHGEGQGTVPKRNVCVKMLIRKQSKTTPALLPGWLHIPTVALALL